MKPTGFRIQGPVQNNYLQFCFGWCTIPCVSIQFKRTPDGKIKYRGELFAGFNKPKKAPAGDPKKYVVLAKDGSKVAKVKFGQRGYEDYLQHGDDKRRANFKSRMNCSESKDKTTPKWWACNFNW